MTSGIHGYRCVCGGHDTHGSRNTTGVYSTVTTNTFDYNSPTRTEDRQIYNSYYYDEPPTITGAPNLLQEKRSLMTVRPGTSARRTSPTQMINCNCAGTCICTARRETVIKPKPPQRPRTAGYGRPVPRDYLNFVNDASSKYWQVMGDHTAKGKFFDRSGPIYHGRCCNRCNCTHGSSAKRLTKSYRTTYDDDFNRNRGPSRDNGFRVTQPSGKHGAYYTGTGGHNVSYWTPAAKYSQLASQLFSSRPIHGYTYKTTYNDAYSRPSGKVGTFRNYSYQSQPKIGSNWSRGCCCCNLYDHAVQMISRS